MYISHRFTDSERDCLKRVLAEVKYDHTGGKDYIIALKRIAHAWLPARMLNDLHEQKSGLNPAAALIFENIPCDVCVHTVPLSGEAPSVAHKSGYLSENMTVLIASMIGDPYSIHFEGPGLCNNLVPYPENRAEYTGLGSSVELDLHIENAALKHMFDDDLSPKGLVLTGVRSDPQNLPLTRVADARQALMQLSEKDIAELRTPNFVLQAPYRWRANAKSQHTISRVPILYGPPTSPSISVAFYPGMTYAFSASGKKALWRFYQALKAVEVKINIQPGMLIYIDNRFALHARDAFKSNLDAAGRPYRWVQRTFVTSHLWNFRSLNNVYERVFST